MTRKRHWFSDFRLRELDWWLNVRDSENEIEDKQFIELENFNFDWNKLVNSKWINEEINTWDWQISWLTKYWDDIYYTKLWALYKNSDRISWYWYVIQPSTVYDDHDYSFDINWVTIAYTSSSSATQEEIVDWLYDAAKLAIPDMEITADMWALALRTMYKPWYSLYISDLSWWSITLDNIDTIAYNSKTWLIDWNSNITVYNDFIILTYKDNSVNRQQIVRFWVVQNFSNSDDYAKVNTVYNWKLVLWSFEQWNAILFSKAADATNPMDLVDFTEYSAWSQQIGTWWTITWFYIWEDGLYVFKEDEVYYSNTEKDTKTTFNFVFKKITSTWAINQACITWVKQDIFYFDWISKSVRRISYEQNLTTLRDTSISDEIWPLIENLPDNQSIATAEYKYPNYKIYLRSDDTLTWNDLCFVYNVDNKSWTTEKLLNNITSSYEWISSWINWIIYSYDNNSYRDEWRAVSKSFDFWDAVDFKRIWEVEISGRIAEWLTLYVDVYVWDELVRTEKIIKTWIWLIQFKKRLNLYNDWQKINYSFRYKWTWRVEIDSVNIQYKKLKWFIEYT